MSVSKLTKQAYSEVDEFIGLLSEYNQNKIPDKLKKFFKEEKDKEYIKGIDINKPIKEQNLMKETLAIIALLNLQYWCEDESEKERLMQVYSSNEKIFQEEQKIKYNPNEIFKKNIINNEIKQEERKENITLYESSLIKRIINKVLIFLHLK